jgi:ferredoxin
MKINVDFDLCEANAVCMKVAPEVFLVDENDELHIKVKDVPDNLRAKVEEAVRRCPRQALSLVE